MVRQPTGHPISIIIMNILLSAENQEIEQMSLNFTLRPTHF